MPRTGPQLAWGVEKVALKTVHKVGLGAFALLMGASLLAMRPQPMSNSSPNVQAHMRLASLSTAARHDVDYRLLDSRLRRLMTKPSMVGMAVGVVENGRITFLQGYGETLAGSGQPVTPQTVFRWASVSKGVASTMVAKLAEQGKINLHAPVVNYAPDLKLPNGNEYRATVADLLSHRLGLYRNAYDNKLEEGHDPSQLRRSGAWTDAVKLLERELSRGAPDTRERLSFELGLIYTWQMKDPAAGCAHWVQHGVEYPQGRFALEVDRAAATLGCTP